MKIDAEMMSFESLRHENDEQHEDFSDHVEPPVDMETPIEVPSKIQFPDPDKPEPLTNRLLWLVLQNPMLLTEPVSVPERSRLVKYSSSCSSL